LIVDELERGASKRSEGEFDMRAILGAVCFVLATAPAWAGPCASSICRGPTPLLGQGFPAAVAIGGALFGARFLKRK